jgi:hypothetical protein
VSTDPITPDTKDWTWVLERPCPDCGFDPARVEPAEVGERIARDATDWVDRLTRSGVRDRPVPHVWSILEYGCHIRDVHRIFDHRVRLMLTEDAPVFPNWDQDATALSDDYPSQDPAVVARELFEATTPGRGVDYAATEANSPSPPSPSITCTTSCTTPGM